jgi:t-SNARE complex subunit (syntaxin)
MQGKLLVPLPLFNSTVHHCWGSAALKNSVMPFLHMQGEMLDNIQKQVERSVAFVEDGTKALVDAKQLQKKTRKLMCCALAIVLIVALIIVLAVVRPWQFANH